MAEIKAIIFDLGRVLIGIDNARGLTGWIQKNTAFSLEQLMHDDFFLSFNRGEITPEDFWKIGCCKLSADFSYSEFCSLWCEFFFPQDGMEELVSKLQQHHHLGLLSDTDPLHWGHIKRKFPWIARTFLNPCLSFEIGECKPAVKCFETAVDSVGVPAENCLFIDDLEKNIHGAINSGLQAIQFSSPANLAEELKKRGITL